MHILTNKLVFPLTHTADENGLLAIGGDLSVARLLLAYRSGIFPWFNEEDPICWWSPDPRFVLFPQHLKVSKSMQSVINKNEFEFTTNTAFEKVITHCRIVHRPGQAGTWITHEMLDAYVALHKAGYAHSAEAWKDGKLAGGLYGIRLGKVFFGESMFCLQSNASKFAFIQYTRLLAAASVELIDCQQETAHLKSFGAGPIARSKFEALLRELL